jgi:hypothetical protein
MIGVRSRSKKEGGAENLDDCKLLMAGANVRSFEPRMVEVKIGEREWGSGAVGHN